MVIDEREVNSLKKKIFQSILLRGFELMKIGGEGRNQVREEVGHKPLRGNWAASLNQAYLFVHLDFSYEATTVGNWTSGASFYTQESPKAESR